MNPDSRELISAEEEALNKWKKNIPVNRLARRNQMSKNKYYLELNESDTFWSVYAVTKDGNKTMVDNSANYKAKKTEDTIEENTITESVD